MRLRVILGGLLLALLLIGGMSAATPTAADELAAPSAVVYHVVRPGEYVLFIARRYGVTAQAIIDANRLRYPYRIYPGQVLVIPVTAPPTCRTHTVRPGESLVRIARLYGVPWGDIAVANGLSYPFTIYVGQRLCVPTGAPVPPTPPPSPCLSISSPAAGATVLSPIRVSGFGRATQHNTVTVRVRNAAGTVVGQANAMIQAELGQPGPFTVDVPFAIPVGTQVGRIEVVDFSPRDGSVVCQVARAVRLRR